MDQIRIPFNIYPILPPPSPTDAYPISLLIHQVQLTQSLAGVSLAVASSKAGTAAITNAIATVAQVPAFLPT